MTGVQVHHLRVVIGGIDLAVDTLPFQTIEDARDVAILLTRNTGRPKGDWEAYSLAGQRLSMDTFADDLDIVFFCPNIGAGGAFWSRRPEKSETIPVALTEEEAASVAAAEVWPTCAETTRTIVSGLLASLSPPSGPIKARILRGERDTDYFSD